MKEQVIKEILALLDDAIDNEIAAMREHYTVAEIAREVLLSYSPDEKNKT